MKGVLITSLTALISFALGVVISLSIRRSSPPQSTEPSKQIVVSKCPSAADLMEREKYVVITVPNDNEFYIGKSQIPLQEITERVRSLTSGEDPDKRVVFVKGEPNVRYSTLSRLIIQIKNADISRVELVPDRRKR